MRIFGAWMDVKLRVVIVGVENLDAQAGLCHSFKIQTFFFQFHSEGGNSMRFQHNLFQL